LRAERWAAPEPARLAMCLRLDAASIAVPSGDRSGPPAFSAAGLDEGYHFTPGVGTIAAMAALKPASASIAFQAAISDA